MSEQLEAARAAVAGDRFSEAKAAYEQLIISSPDSAFLHVELGRVERAQGNIEAALAHARQAQRLDPTDPATFLFEGELQEEVEDLPGAILAYERADRLDPTEATARRIERLDEHVRRADLPLEILEIPSKSMVTRGDLAALVGVRFPNLLRDGASRRPVIITDTRNYWGSQWIQSVTQAQVMTVDAGYRFEPTRTLQRGELAQAVAAVLDLIASLDPAAASRWDDARSSFSDMRPGHLNYPSAARAVAAGVIRVLKDDRFRPTSAVDGAEAVETVDRLAETGTRVPVAECVVCMKTLTLANQLTLARLLLVPALVILVIYGYNGWALITFVVAGITDALDGLAARRAGERTSLGALLEPDGGQAAAGLDLRGAYASGTGPGEPPPDLAHGARDQSGCRDRADGGCGQPSRRAVHVSTFNARKGHDVRLHPHRERDPVHSTIWAARRCWSDVTIYAALGLTLLSGFHYIAHAARLVNES